MKYRPAFCLVVGALMVSACGGDAPPEETEAEAERNAKGEVVGGTISDAMIPLDQLRSQSPPMREAPSRPTATAAPVEEAPVEVEPVETAPQPAPEPPAEAEEN
jgi:hypothetical protein